jgi:hypothetical protein
MNAVSDNPVITVAQLKLCGVCARWRAKLFRMFGPVIPVTLEVCVEHAEDIDWDEATYLLHGRHRCQYIWKYNEALSEHEIAAAPAYAELKVALLSAGLTAASIRGVGESMRLLPSSMRKVNNMAAHVYRVWDRTATAEFRRAAADSLMRFKLRLAAAFYVEYSMQWENEQPRSLAHGQRYEGVREP